MEITNLPQETDLLKKVEVRLLRDDERERFDQLLCERHYLIALAWWDRDLGMLQSSRGNG